MFQLPAMPDQMSPLAFGQLQNRNCNMPLKKWGKYKLSHCEGFFFPGWSMQAIHDCFQRDMKKDRKNCWSSQSQTNIGASVGNTSTPN